MEIQLPGVGVLATVAVPSTGRWQAWTSVTATVTLPAGAQRLRLYIPAGGYGFNLNWLDVEKATGAAARTARAVPHTTAAQRRAHCLAGLRPSARLDPSHLAATCFGA